MPFCRKCGTKMEAKSQFCSKCGVDNKSKTLIPSKLEVDVGPRIGEHMFPKLLKAWWFIAIIVVIILVFIMVFAFNFLSKFPF